MNLWVILPSLALVSGILTSFYFFVEWIRHKKTGHARFLLLWALGLFLMYWFQVPVIVANMGRLVSLQNFNLFFSLTFPITLAALFLYFVGLLESFGFRPTQKHHIALFSFLGASMTFFGYFFIAHKGVIQTYALPIGGLLLFYVPMYLLIVRSLAKEMFFSSSSKTPLFLWGAREIAIASFLGLVRAGIVFKNVVSYPPEFWYIAMNSSRLFFILQAVSTLLFALGFFSLYRAHHVSQNETSDNQ